MNGLKFSAIVLCFLIMLCAPCFAAPGEGIFIESISHASNQKLTLDEIRARPLLIPVTRRKETLIEVEGEYQLENGSPENPYIAKDRARSNARRAASEQALIHVKAVSESKNGKLTKDELNVLSMAVIRIESENVAEEKLTDGVLYRCRIKAYINSAEELLEQAAGDRDALYENVRSAIEIERESARLNAELASLKNKYKRASEKERKQIAEEIKLNDAAFGAAVWNEKGYESYNKRDMEGAIACFKKALEVEPKNAKSYNGLSY
ncbi:MAG: tetratricopeptide repeat protein, partial [Selenomonadaceae bacterium]|nr:tetratricopeptide repeat protein [Selenomonadaceae bacterium]